MIANKKTKILFASIDNENPGGKRGIHSIVKPMVKASRDAGNSNGIITGLPLYKVANSDPILQSKLRHLFLHRYLQDGYKTNQSIIPSLSRLQKIRRMKEYLVCRVFDKSIVMYTDPDKIPDSKSSWLREFDFSVNVPFFYVTHIRGKIHTFSKRLSKAVKKTDTDVVLMGWPTSLVKSDVAPAKLVTFIHDSMYLDIDSEPIDNSTPQKFAQDLYNSCHESDLVMANSTDTKNKVLEINPNAKVKVLYGVAPKAQLSKSTNALTALGLEKDGYFLFVSSMEKRKNVLNILNAFLNIADKTDKDLVFVGSPGYQFEEVEQVYSALPKQIKKRIHFTGYVPLETKNQLFSHANLYLSPSLYEGLGLTPVEAMAYGVPVISSCKGALPEAVGDAGLYVDDPYDINEIADKMLDLSTNKKLRKDLVEKGYERVGQFTQEKFDSRFTSALAKLQSN